MFLFGMGGTEGRSVSPSSFLHFPLCGPWPVANIKGTFVFMQKCGHRAAIGSDLLPLFPSRFFCFCFSWHLYPLFLTPFSFNTQYLCLISPPVVHVPDRPLLLLSALVF